MDSERLQMMSNVLAGRGPGDFEGGASAETPPAASPVPTSEAHHAFVQALEAYVAGNAPAPSTLATQRAEAVERARLSLAGMLARPPAPAEEVRRAAQAAVDALAAYRDVHHSIEEALTAPEPQLEPLMERLQATHDAALMCHTRLNTMSEADVKLLELHEPPVAPNEALLRQQLEAFLRGADDGQKAAETIMGLRGQFEVSLQAVPQPDDVLAKGTDQAKELAEAASLFMEGYMRGIEALDGIRVALTSSRFQSLAAHWAALHEAFHLLRRGQDICESSDDVLDWTETGALGS